MLQSFAFFCGGCHFSSRWGFRFACVHVSAPDTPHVWPCIIHRRQSNNPRSLRTANGTGSDSCDRVQRLEFPPFSVSLFQVAALRSLHGDTRHSNVVQQRIKTPHQRMFLSCPISSQTSCIPLLPSCSVQLFLSYCIVSSFFVLFRFKLYHTSSHHILLYRIVPNHIIISRCTELSRTFTHVKL